MPLLGYHFAKLTASPLFSPHLLLVVCFSKSLYLGFFLLEIKNFMHAINNALLIEDYDTLIQIQVLLERYHITLRPTCKFLSYYTCNCRCVNPVGISIRVTWDVGRNFSLLMTLVVFA